MQKVLGIGVAQAFQRFIDGLSAPDSPILPMNQYDISVDTTLPYQNPHKWWWPLYEIIVSDGVARKKIEGINAQDIWHPVNNGPL